MANPLHEQLSIEKELREERSNALKRVGDTLEKLLEELRALDGLLARATGDERERAKKRHEEVRTLASRQLWYMIVQREAMGLTRHDSVYEIYRVPPSVGY